MELENLKVLLALAVFFAPVQSQIIDRGKAVSAPEPSKLDFNPGYAALKGPDNNLKIPPSLTRLLNVPRTAAAVVAPGPTTPPAKQTDEWVIPSMAVLSPTPGQTSIWPYYPQETPGEYYEVGDDFENPDKFDWNQMKIDGACKHDNIWLTNVTTPDAPLVEDCFNIMAKFASKGGIHGMGCYKVHKYRHRTCQLNIWCRDRDGMRHAVIADVDYVHLLDNTIRYSRTANRIGGEGAFMCRDETGTKAIVEWSIWRFKIKHPGGKKKPKNKIGRDVQDVEEMDSFWDQDDSDVIIID
ncbi:Hypothetical protein R9X50_00792800 [Acrodontium crateriforme]|uniref:Ecp2 effector protein-like domain-containing protein n=1 Tax=Acrodontium crateriforme TaxID=150365 RepID=A0AAQ3MC37_9PEZI|nr:Hypothetical protein R9X50_00792800 [Acrodontium crateriforme]